MTNVEVSIIHCVFRYASFSPFPGAMPVRSKVKLHSPPPARRSPYPIGMTQRAGRYTRREELEFFTTEALSSRRD